MRSKVFRTDKYLIVAGSFLFVSAFVVYHGSRHVLLEYFNENRFQFDDHQPQFLEDSTEPVDPLENQIFDEKITCGCDSLSRLAVLIQSTCSYEADERGFNQSVISYSLFGKPDEDDNVRKRYFSTISDKAGRIARYYPGWIMRVYHNLTKDQEIQYLCPLRCKHSNVDLCHVEKIHTKEITNALIQRANPRMWRFLVMLDPLVDRFMSRDVDSEIIPRETAAVKQWLRSKYTFHVMRDHPSMSLYNVTTLKQISLTVNFYIIMLRSWWIHVGRALGSKEFPAKTTHSKACQSYDMD